MSVYQRNTGINIVQRFWTIDPTTGDPTLSDPETVVFVVRDPNGVETTYTFGVDGNVTHLSTGLYICKLAAPLPTGDYRWNCTGTGNGVDASSEDNFDILPSGVLEPANPTVAVPGPCSSWISGDDVAAFGNTIPGIGESTFLLDDFAFGASAILWSLSGRQFPGICQRTVRPCADNCACWGAYDIASGLAPWYWSAVWFGGYGGYWYDECGNRCGCGAESKRLLGGYPVREILSVKIGGVELPEFDPYSGFRNWRLDGRRYLTRMANPGPPVQEQFWPACQNLGLDDDQPGTFSITYTWGAEVPWSGRMAAAELARELYLASANLDCKLPNRTTKMVRAGVSMERIVGLASLLRSGATGLRFVDAFIADVNPTGRKMKSAVFSPDGPTFAKKVGQT